MTPVGVQTPSTTRANRLRQPLESPFPPSPPSPSAASGADDVAVAGVPTSHGLSDRHLLEIRTLFQIFDPTLSGHVDLPTFEVIVRSLGFRMTQVEIACMVELLWEERQEQGQVVDTMDANERRQIDLPMAIHILARKGYANRNEEDEMQMYFRIFDHGNKGYITLGDLQKVQNEVKEAEREMDIGDGSGMDVGVVGDATLQAMIEQFDHNRDGVLDYHEFTNIIEPILSSSTAISS